MLRYLGQGMECDLELLWIWVRSRLRDKPFDVDEDAAIVRLSVCIDCWYFKHRTCQRWGKACQAFEKWIDRIVAGDCEHWG